MNAIKVAIKRQRSDESPLELDYRPKKIKVDKEIDEETVVNQKDTENANTQKSNQQLSLISHFKEKYKYYCKKHNVMYLIEKTRNKSKEFSKKHRDNLVNRFRSLDLIKVASIKEPLENSQQFLFNNKVGIGDDEKNSFDQPKLSKGSVTEGINVSRIFLTSYKNETDNSSASCNQDESTGTQSLEQLNIRDIIKRFILCDESEDSDYEESFKKESYEKSKVENFLLTRSPGGNHINMTKVEDSSYTSDYEECCTYRDCYYGHHVKNNLYNYDTSDDEDNAFSNHLYTG